MKLFIQIPGDNAPKQLANLKNYLENSHIEEVKSLEFERVKSNEGEMAVAGIVTSLTAVLVGVVNPFSRIVQAITSYATSFRTEIILKNEYGDEIVLNTKKLDEAGIQLLVDKFLSKKSKK